METRRPEVLLKERKGAHCSPLLSLGAEAAAFFCQAAKKVAWGRLSQGSARQPGRFGEFSNIILAAVARGSPVSGPGRTFPSDLFLLLLSRTAPPATSPLSRSPSHWSSSSCHCQKSSCRVVWSRWISSIWLVLDRNSSPGFFCFVLVPWWLLFGGWRGSVIMEPQLLCWLFFVNRIQYLYLGYYCYLGCCCCIFSKLFFSTYIFSHSSLLIGEKGKVKNTRRELILECSIRIIVLNHFPTHKWPQVHSLTLV